MFNEDCLCPLLRDRCYGSDCTFCFSYHDGEVECEIENALNAICDIREDLKEGCYTINVEQKK